MRNGQIFMVLQIRTDSVLHSIIKVTFWRKKNMPPPILHVGMSDFFFFIFFFEYFSGLQIFLLNWLMMDIISKMCALPSYYLILNCDKKCNSSAVFLQVYIYFFFKAAIPSKNGPFSNYSSHSALQLKKRCNFLFLEPLCLIFFF